jgi:hypothetical protein
MEAKYSLSTKYAHNAPMDTQSLTSIIYDIVYKEDYKDYACLKHPGKLLLCGFRDGQS